MAKDPAILRKKFCKHIMKKWIQNNHDLKEIKCVYAMISIDCWNTKEMDIEYIGSTVRLFSRYKSHKVPQKIQNEGKINLLYYLPMNKGFYDYEIKLINTLKPKYNKQHKNGS